MIVYHRQQSPGCGGCLLVAVLVLLAMGGAPLLFNVLGFLLFSGLFTVLLVALGFWGLTQYLRRQASRYEQSQTESHNQFVFLLVHILVRIAQIDGTVTKAEINTITNFFRVHLRYSQSQLYWVRDLVDEAVRSDVTLDALLTEFRARFAYEPRLILLELIYQVLFANPQVSPNELAMVQTIADFLEINPYDHLSIRSRYVGGGARPGSAGGAGRRSDEARYFETLGLEPGASFEEIKSAYRKLSMKYHPDKVGHLGEEFRQVAEEKMKELNQAYQYLKERYG